MAYQWHEDSSQENGHIDQLILMPGRTLLKPKAMQSPFNH